jgi:hypothetical protein
VSATEILALGRAVLDPILSHHGFVFDEAHANAHSNERFARGSWVRGNRRMEVGCREELDVVLYEVGGDLVAHDAYMRTVLGPVGSNMFPCVTGDPIDGFRHLAYDLERYAGAFLSGTDEHFKLIVQRAQLLAEGDERTTLYRR